MDTKLHDPEQSKPLLENEGAQTTLVGRVRHTLMPYKRVIQVVNAIVLVCYIIAVLAAHHGQPEHDRRSEGLDIQHD